VAIEIGVCVWMLAKRMWFRFVRLDCCCWLNLCVWSFGGVGFDFCFVCTLMVVDYMHYIDGWIVIICCWLFEMWLIEDFYCAFRFVYVFGSIYVFRFPLVTWLGTIANYPLITWLSRNPGWHLTSDVAWVVAGHRSH
jgi:hypothetical protein